MLHMPTFDSVVGIVFEVIGYYLLRDYVAKVAKYNSLAIGQKWLEEPSFFLYDELITNNKKAFIDLKNKVAANKMIFAKIKFCTKRQYGVDLTRPEEKGKPIQLNDLLSMAPKKVGNDCFSLPNFEVTKKYNSEDYNLLGPVMRVVAVSKTGHRHLFCLETSLVNCYDIQGDRCFSKYGEKLLMLISEIIEIARRKSKFGESSHLTYKEVHEGLCDQIKPKFPLGTIDDWMEKLKRESKL